MRMLDMSVMFTFRGHESCETSGYVRNRNVLTCALDTRYTIDSSRRSTFCGLVLSFSTAERVFNCDSVTRILWAMRLHRCVYNVDVGCCLKTIVENKDISDIDSRRIESDDDQIV
jgi:hypothetical protein